MDSLIRDEIRSATMQLIVSIKQEYPSDSILRDANRVEELVRKHLSVTMTELWEARQSQAKDYDCHG